MPQARPISPIKILFIGNSFTQRNELPTLIEHMAVAVPEPHQVQTHRVIANGASLRRHWNKGDALEAIQQGGWDYVVLQEQSTLPIKNANRFHENVRLFDDAIKKCGAQTVLYLTWARREMPETQAALDDATRAIAREISALVVPVGPAWQTTREKIKTLGLYDSDGSHPSQAGSYLAACVFIAALLGQSPVGLAIPDSIKIDTECAAILQQVAWQTVSADATHSATTP